MNLFNLPLLELLHFVKVTCHENLHDVINDLRGINEAFLKNGSTESPVNLILFLNDFIRLLQLHLALEENDFYLLIEKGKKEMKIFPIYKLLEEHDEIKEYLINIRKLTGDYEIISTRPEIRQLHLKLQELDRIVVNHIHLQNHVLFPMIIGFH